MYIPLIPLILTSTLWSGYCYCLHLPDEETCSSEMTASKFQGRGWTLGSVTPKMQCSLLPLLQKIAEPGEDTALRPLSVSNACQTANHQCICLIHFTASHIKPLGLLEALESIFSLNI